MRKPKRTRKQILAALRESAGNVTLAAKMLGYNRGWLNDIVQADADFKAVVNDQRESMIDHSENKLMKAILAGAPWAIKTVLLTLGRNRGYVTRSEVQELEPKSKPVASMTTEEIEAELRATNERIGELKKTN